MTERFVGTPAWVVVTQLFIGLGWLRAVAEKVIDPRWWAGEVIEEFASTHADATLAWYAPFLDNVVLRWAPVVGVVVLAGQAVAATSLVSGRHLNVGLLVGAVLNLHFMAAGAVTPSAFYLLAQGALMLWLCEQNANRSTAKTLQTRAAAAAFVAGLNLAFISTVHPGQVIDDPAVMFSFGGALAALACLLAAESVRRDRPGVPAVASQRHRVA